jgi:hypothetical protein
LPESMDAQLLLAYKGMNPIKKSQISIVA